MKPTVGRVVYYKTLGSPNGEFTSTDRAAIITNVINDIRVSLCILNPNGMYFNLDVEQGQEAGKWDWMPPRGASTKD